MSRPSMHMARTSLPSHREIGIVFYLAWALCRAHRLWSELWSCTLKGCVTPSQALGRIGCKEDGAEGWRHARPARR